VMGVRTGTRRSMEKSFTICMSARGCLFKPGTFGSLCFQTIPPRLGNSKSGRQCVLMTTPLTGP
jgi:hypothetical protein